jgi:hypothetical protein
MNKLYSERNGLRAPRTKTAIIDIDSYAILWDCCDRYKTNLAWKYPEYCYDNSQVIYGVSEESLNAYIRKAIPDLIYGHPAKEVFVVNPFDDGIIEGKAEDTRNFYSILDFIEFVAQGIKTIKIENYHKYFNHNHLSFIDDNKDFEKYRKEINEAFETCALSYVLSEAKVVERVVDDGFVIEESKVLIDATPEAELKKLIEEAVALHKSRKPEDHRLATEKIWDAFDRLKTLFAKKQSEKSTSSDAIIGMMANGDSNYQKLFLEEFNQLREIGNNYRIRHHETYKIDISNDEYFDYFFCRCFAMIVLALKYIK